MQGRGRPEPCRTGEADGGCGNAGDERGERSLGPGQMMTLDHREDRVTIEADPSSGRVVAARCG